MITFNLGNNSPKKDKQQDIKIADLQAAVDELNTQIDAISITLGNLSASIDDKYAAQTQTLMNALTAQINSLSSALESALTTGQLTAQIANIERLMVTVSAGFVALEAETAKIESLEAEDIESDSVKADSAEIKTLSAEKAVFNEATITLLNMLALTVQSLTADTASIEEVTAENVSSEKIETDLLNAEHIAGGAWHTPISTPDNTELLHISIPQYNGMAQLQTEDNEFNVSILNNYLVSYNQRGEYLYRIERKDESVDIYLQNIGDTVNYRVLFVGSETSGTVTSELVDKTAYRQTITDFAGVLSLESVLLDVNILFCDYLPDEGEENNLYVVKTQGTYLWNESAREFIPLMGTNWQTKILSNESKIGDLAGLPTTVKTNLVSAINEFWNNVGVLAGRVTDVEGRVTDVEERVSEVEVDKLSKLGGTISGDVTVEGEATLKGNVYAEKNLKVKGDLIVEGQTLTTEEQTLATDSNYAVLRKNNPSGLASGEKSGVVIHNYQTGKNASLAVSNDGEFRVSDNVAETTTIYTNLAKFGNTYYSGLDSSTVATVAEGAAVSEDVDVVADCVLETIGGKWYHSLNAEWFEMSLVDNALSFDKESPVTDETLIATLESLTRQNLFYFRSLSILVISDSTDQPLLTREEAEDLQNNDILVWDGTNRKATKAPRPSASGQQLAAMVNGGTVSLQWITSVTIDNIYPVGSIYWTGRAPDNGGDPNVLFGGTWVQIKDRFVLAAGDTYTVNAKGGVPTNTLTVNNIPKHTHTLDHTHKYTPSGKIASTSNGQEDEKVAWALGTARLTLTDPAGSGAYPQIGFSSNNNTIVEVAMINRNQGTYLNQYPFNGLNYIDFKLGHSHSAYFRGSQGTTTSQSSSTTSSYGKETPDALNNMPPYIVKYCWERTA